MLTQKQIKDIICNETVRQNFLTELYDLKHHHNPKIVQRAHRLHHAFYHKHKNELKKRRAVRRLLRSIREIDPNFPEKIMIHVQTWDEIFQELIEKVSKFRQPISSSS